MKSRSQGDWNWKRIAWGMLLALAALAPGRVQAGCSRHVLLRAEPLAGVARLDILTLDAGLPSALSTSTLPAGLPRPCHGPSCSGTDSSPVPAPAFSTLAHVQEWGLIADALLPDEPGTGDFAKIAPPLHPVQRDESVDRPPRLSPSALLSHGNPG